MRAITSAAELESLLQTHPLFVAYFSSEGCNVCKVLKPKISALIDRLEIPGAYIDSASLPEVAGQHLVLAIPTTLVFQMGRAGDRFGRHLSMHQLEATLSRFKARMAAILEAPEP